VSGLKGVQIADLKAVRRLCLNHQPDGHVSHWRPVELVGDLKGAISRRINIQHRLVYQVLDSERTVKVLRIC